ncbi:DUF4177 domain-containing protein [Lysobacter pythonis]|uniref:DUF4177 domain-containing protein n=1 Tax=Solilutibacter pythonis TaxID=2483112 RepID=A0A3M2HW22_9GAMM|nr:DUF4177 domain-containing protein [Lysobacter pythonis]RMH91102.1 DUF4177 domain-containing protein [Lysobacter pythonis]
MNERWEYKVIDVSANLSGRPGEKVERTLNELGEDGWELVSALRGSLMEPTRLYLKRRLG